MSITTAITLEHISNADHVPRRTLSSARLAHKLSQTHLLVLTRGMQCDSYDLLRSEACSSVSCTSQTAQLAGCPRVLTMQFNRDRVEADNHPI